jgi:hypothetical protein
MTSARDLESVRKRLKWALGINGLSVRQYAEEFLCISHTHLNLVLRGKRTSKRVLDEVQALVNDTIANLPPSQRA